MVDRSGWDQSFVDVGNGGSSQLASATNGNSVLNGRRTVDCSSDMDPDALRGAEIGGDFLRLDHRLKDLVRELRIGEFRHAAAGSEPTPRASTGRVDATVNVRQGMASPSSVASSLRLSHRVLPVDVDRVTSAESTPTNGGCGSCLSPSCASDSGTNIGRHASGSVFDAADLLSSPASSSHHSTTNAFFDDAFPTYENTSRTFLPTDGRLSAVCSTSSSTGFQTASADTPSPFDSSVWQGFGWTTSELASSQRIARHSSSASDFVGSSTTGSPPPFAVSSGGIDICCRSSTSPFRGGSGSQSDSGCSDGGGDSSDHVSSSALHFRFPVGPSPIIDDCPSAVAAISRCRDGVVQPSAIRCQNDAADVPTACATTISATTPAARTSSASAYSRVVGFLPAWDVERLETVYSRLKVSGFYYGRMSIDEATERLRRTPVGTFLLRDSADERYLFSTSVQTCRGTTSIRIAFRSGLFRLDCSADQEHLMPTFDCVLRLIAYYVGLCKSISSGSRNPSSSSAASAIAAPPAAAPPAGNSYVLLETSGRRDTPVLLRNPLKDRVSPLAHLCRRTVHAALNRGVGSATGSGLSASELERSALVDRLQLVPSLKRYLKDYPYDL